MKKQFYLEGERVTLRRAKRLIGEERYARVLRNAKSRFLRDPLADIRYMTREGILTIWFQPD
jgi:hypothetical protein